MKNIRTETLLLLIGMVGVITLVSIYGFHRYCKSDDMEIKTNSTPPAVSGDKTVEIAPAKQSYDYKKSSEVNLPVTNNTLTLNFDGFKFGGYKNK